MEHLEAGGCAPPIVIPDAAVSEVTSPLLEEDLAEAEAVSGMLLGAAGGQALTGTAILRAQKAAGAEWPRLNTGQQKISGYRDPSIEELALIQRVKAKGLELGTMIEDIEHHYDAVIATFDTPGDEPSSITAEQEREIVEALEWVREGKKMLQIGMMLVKRGVARPRGF